MTEDVLVLIENLKRRFKGGNWPFAVKRYVVRGAQIHLHFKILGGGDGDYWCAYFERAKQDGDEFLNVGDSHGFPEPDEGDRGDCFRQIERTVLIPFIEIVEQPEGMLVGNEDAGIEWIHSVERLQLLEDCPARGRHPTNLLMRSSLASKVVLRLQEDRELGSRVGDTPVEDDQFPDNVVKGAPKIVDAVSDDGANPGRFHTGSLSAENILMSVGIKFAGDQVRFSISDPLNRLVDGVEMLISPRQFQPTSI